MKGYILLTLTGLWCVGTAAFLEAAPVPEDPVERALEAYCNKYRVERKKLQPVELNLVPGARGFRYLVPGLAETEDRGPLSERYVIVLVDTKTGDLFDLRITEHGTNEYIKDHLRPLFKAMKEKGRKVTDAKQAQAILIELIQLDAWIIYGAFDRPDPGKGLRVHGPYRSRPNSYGAVHGWHGGDDVGLILDADGFAIQLVGGHIR